MGQLQKVSWRTAGYAALGTVFAAASVVAVVNSNGVRPTALASSSATRWLVDQVNGRVVLVDGLAGRVVAKITTESEDTDEVAVQGVGGAFLVAKKQGSIRTISTAKLQLGTAQAVGLLLDDGVKFGVGASGLTVVSPDTSEASIVAVDDVSRKITVPKAESALVAADGSMWLLSKNSATHVNVDGSTTSALRRATALKTTVGAHAVSYDNTNRVLRWLDGGDVSLASIPNASEAILQEPSDDAPCVWLGVGDTLICVGESGIDHTVVIDGLSIDSTDRLAIAGGAAVVVTKDNQISRIDLEREELTDDEVTTVRDGANLAITASGDLIWIDDPEGEQAWVVHRFGINPIRKDADAPLLDAQGHVQDGGESGVSPDVASGNPSTDEENDHLDLNDRQDPPVAVNDSVTARAGTVITIPVTGNDYDPDGDAIAVLDADTQPPTHGTADVLDGSSVAYRPELGYSGSDSFVYTITDEHGAHASATVNIELFPPGSPNRPPIARADKETTRINRPVTIDVLANDIDPERDLLSVPTFQNSSTARITDTFGPTGLPALRYQPPPDQAGIFTFTYQAADPQGGTSQKTVVTVEVLGDSADNVKPKANPDAIRLSVGVTESLPVLSNDTDADGDELKITGVSVVDGVQATIEAQQLKITLLPSAQQLSVITYTLSDGDSTHDVTGRVLVVRLGDTAPNHPPVANADADRVVIGNSVKIPVTANDVDPDHDVIRLLTAEDPIDGSGTTSVEGNFVRFTPNIPDLTEKTTVTFQYRISDGHGNDATGNVTVTVLVEALPAAPFARDDFADTVTDQSVNIDVLANDSDPSGGRPSLIAEPVCASGDAVRTADERVTFTPPPGEIGTFRCKYTVSNIQGFRAEASIIVSVTPAPPGNSPPVVDPSKTLLTVPVGSSVTLTADIIAHDPDGDSLVFSSVTMGTPKSGNTNFTQKAPSFTYSAPTTSSADFTSLIDTLDVTISDGHDGNTRAPISILIVPPNAPAGTLPSTHEIQRPAVIGDTIPIDVVAELRDSNIGSNLTLTAANLESGPGSVDLVNGIAVVKTTGAGIVLVNYTVTNATGSKSDRIKITVAEPPPGAPPVAVDDAMTIASGGSNSIDLLANDTGFSDPGDKVTVQLINRPPSTFGSVGLVNGVLTFSAAPGANGLATIRYSLSDGTATSTANVALNVLGCSESLPNATNAEIFTPYMTPISIDLRTYVISGHIRAGSVSGAGLTDVTGVYTPPAHMNGSEVVTYVVENGCQQTFQGQLTIDVNRAPQGGSITRNLSRGSITTLLAADLASDDPGEALKITGLGDTTPPWVSIAADQGSIVAAPPSNASSNEYRFSVTVQDPGGLTAAASLDLIINNLPPTAIDDAYTTDQQVFTFNPTSNDFDSEPGPLCIQAVTPLDSNTTAVSTSPNDCPTQVTVSLVHGVASLRYDIRDIGGITSSATITINFNRAPRLEAASESTNGQDTVHVPLVVTEPDGDPVDITCDAPPGFGANILTDPDPDDDPIHPRFDLIVSVPPEFNSNTDNTATIPCTVRDGIAPPVTALMTITVV